MLAERYLKRRFEEGRQQERERWLKWNERREQAQQQGKPFNEPPPSEKNS